MPTYYPKYDQSWALIVGINQYVHCAPLGFARQDAEAVATALERSCGFDPSRITVLTDHAANRNSIWRAYMAMTTERVSENDRVVVFFAGHGFTRTDSRGEVGFLVPVDGDTADLASLLRWDDLTRGGALIPAKHVLFIMDACYGGLAVTRSLAPGSTRFLKDMLCRHARQVLTAGKADEVVSDSGGPRPGHSVFTGHLLDALEGAAVASDGILFTNAVIAYVYDKVARDIYSRQTPHYGYLDGDGDLILRGIPPEAPKGAAGIGTDVVIQTPASTAPQSLENQVESIADQVKRLLSDPKGRIALDDLLTAEIRRALALSADKEFPVNVAFTVPEFELRVSRYESAVDNLVTPLILISRWGDSQQQLLLQKAISRLSDGIEQQGGLVVWLGLRWYAIEYLMYGAGISAIASENYTALSRLFNAPVGQPSTGSSSTAAAAAVVSGMASADISEVFKMLPNFERHYTAKSDYLLGRMQPSLEDQLFLGREYEEHFDAFEILYALVYADARQSRGERLWGPIGRFGWKYGRGRGKSPYDAYVERASALGERWPALQAGFFGGSSARFKDVATRFKTDILDKLQWY